ncbi:ATPase, T2SS/T4P/T4SS family [Sebaldella termitidis]|uniref:ATPase, T2SS/T4P/T4SS family n=1 Tax=Sebaldella termitidis TaxID=826 RepID=UPI00244E1F9D|nr:ATPase, T2SS/T4P/T4SS family [Sebaldella termitidis]
MQNSVFLTTTYHVSMKMLLQSSMRFNSDRIIVGELRRGEETLGLLKAWNLGHAGD